MTPIFSFVTKEIQGLLCNLRLCYISRLATFPDLSVNNVTSTEGIRKGRTQVLMYLYKPQRSIIVIALEGIYLIDYGINIIKPIDKTDDRPYQAKVKLSLRVNPPGAQSSFRPLHFLLLGDQVYHVDIKRARARHKQVTFLPPHPA